MRRHVMLVAMTLFAGCASDPRCGLVGHLAGCVPGQGTSDATNPIVQRSMPVCHTSAGCEAAWGAARRWVLDNSGYKLQHYSLDYMETFNPIGSSRDLAAQVSMESSPDGSHMIKARLWCGSDYGCATSPTIALVHFNDAVGQAIALTENAARP